VENDDLIKIPITSVTNNTDKISYYKEYYTSNNLENRYIIIYPKNGLYDSTVTDDFVNYFSNKYTIYQEDEILKITIYTHNQYNDIDIRSIIEKDTNYVKIQIM